MGGRWCGEVDVDLDQVASVGISTIAALVSARRRACALGGELRLLNVPAAVRIAIVEAGLAGFLLADEPV